MDKCIYSIQGGNRLTHYRHSYIYIYIYTYISICIYIYICLAGSNRSNTSGSGSQSLDRLGCIQRPKLRAGVHFVTALDQSCRDVEVCSSARRAPSTSLGDNSSSPKQSAGYGPQVGVDSGGCQFDADYKAAFWEARGSPILQPAAMKIDGKNNPCIHDRIIVLVFMEATGSP